MSFGNAAIFPFPAVQYIPMAISTIDSGKIPVLTPKTSLPLLMAGAEIEEQRSILFQNYGINIPASFAKDDFPILAINLSVETVKYRGFFITMTGKPNPSFYQLFSVPKHFFYKKNLYLNLYEERSGKLLANYSLFKLKLGVPEKVLNNCQH